MLVLVNQWDSYLLTFYPWIGDIKICTRLHPTSFFSGMHTDPIYLRRSVGNWIYMRRNISE